MISKYITGSNIDQFFKVERETKYRYRTVVYKQNRIYCTVLHTLKNKQKFHSSKK